MIRTTDKYNSGHEVFRCECWASEHMVIVDYYKWSDGEANFYLQVTADQFQPWYKRIWMGIKFMFGFPSLEWHSVDLSYKDVMRLESVINRYKDSIKNEQ